MTWRCPETFRNYSFWLRLAQFFMYIKGLKFLFKLNHVIYLVYSNKINKIFTLRFLHFELWKDVIVGVSALWSLAGRAKTERQNQRTWGKFGWIAQYWIIKLREYSFINAHHWLINRLLAKFSSLQIDISAHVSNPWLSLPYPRPATFTWV